MKLEVRKSNDLILVETDDGAISMTSDEARKFVEGASRLLLGDDEARLVGGGDIEIRDLGDYVELDLLFNRRSHVDDHTYKLSKPNLRILVDGLERAASD